MGQSSFNFLNNLFILYLCGTSLIHPVRALFDSRLAAVNKVISMACETCKQTRVPNQSTDDIVKEVVTMAEGTDSHTAATVSPALTPEPVTFI